MKIHRLITNPNLYSSNAYLVLGDWNKLNDVNALIDTGTDGFVINHIEKINKGVGKNSIDKIIITHNHFDHTGGISEIKEKYNAKVYAFSNSPGVDYLLKEGETIFLGDSYFEVIHTPGHSSDSISLYCKANGALFTGDLNLRVYQTNESYSKEYVDSISKISKLNINVVYPGHGMTITDNPKNIIKLSETCLKEAKTYCYCLP